MLALKDRLFAANLNDKAHIRWDSKMKGPSEGVTELTSGPRQIGRIASGYRSGNIAASRLATVESDEIALQ